jgi:hypothetical protein
MALRDDLASDAHESWMESCRRDGRESMPSAVTGEEQMVPFGQLSDTVKAYDYMLVDVILASLEKRGYGLIPPIDELPELVPSFNDSHYGREADE